MEPRHGRAVIGVLLMLCGLAAYVLVVLHVGAPVERCPATWLQLTRQYGFPALLLIGGYNLYQRGALGEIMTAWRGSKP